MTVLYFEKVKKRISKLEKIVDLTFMETTKMKENLSEIRFSEDVMEKLSVITETGYYHSLDDFLSDAINTILSARRDLRIAIACRLYDKGGISFGRACEVAGVDIETMKKVLNEKGIKRKVSEKSVEEVTEKASRLLRIAGIKVAE